MNVFNYHKGSENINNTPVKYGKYIDNFDEKNISSFCIVKATHIFAEKINVFENTLVTTANEFVINELVKLMLLWTTRSCSKRTHTHTHM